MLRSASESRWSYCQANIAGIVELGSWRGRGSPGLRPHFHDETQIVMVLSGSRVFLIDGTTVTVAAGQAACIPAGMLHVPLATTEDETICLNAYIPAGGSAQSLEVFDIQYGRSSAGRTSGDEFLRVRDKIASHVALHPTVKADQEKLRATLTNSFGRIGEIAASLGQSREGFSRLVTRELGIAPHAFRVLTRLNMARRLLREGQPIAAAAADTGFADQSHLTRLFRRTFGTTPGLYWHG
ncbi:AraC family transcriptional regulator [Bradyrhizobium sp. SZCCHNR2012]|uniref:AraC family transcriptional regulator n=1 Tax=Bradyrhizobium sp. SZCCHNR2012 TaxID=3057377 RepID=UPI0028F06E5B|nr:AraC family transcriptional regulator [Bradyrhizobium sp. SZCCHNR2012]